MPELSPLHLRAIQVRRFKPWPDAFPFNVPIIKNLEELAFTAPVTFLVGENGSGKSTLLEAIACAAGSITVGAENVSKDKSLASVRALAADLKLVWSKKTRRGFFMRSEDFFGFARRMSNLHDEMEDELREIGEEYKDRPAASQELAEMSFKHELSSMRHSYGEGLDARSHGESYLALFQSRFVPGGLYLMDEPEAPLSPTRQLSFLALLHSMIAQDAQFIIATHSPILMAYPGAVILNCDEGKLTETAFNDLEHVTILRTFLNDPENYFRYLFEEN
jgi:predicted ATPase